MKKYIKYLLKIFKKFYKVSFMLIILQICVTSFNLLNPILLQKVIDDGIVKKSQNKVITYALLSIFCLFILNVIRFFYNKLAVKLKTSQSKELKIKIMDNLSEGDLDFYQRNSSGDILKTLESDVGILEEISLDWIVTTIVELMGGIFALSWILKVNHLLLFFVVIAEGLIIIFQKKFVSLLSANAVVLRKLGGKSLGLLEEYVTNIICAIYGKMTRYMQKRFIDNENIFIEKLNKQYSLVEANQLISNTIDELLNIVIYLIGGIFVINSKMSYGELIAFSQYIALIMLPMLTIINSFSKIELAIVSLDRVNYLINMPYIISGSGKIDNDSSIDICFCDVSLGYAEEEVLKNINISLKYGNTYAFVGENGSGKSTIIKALYRMIKIQKGDIYICKKNIDYWDINNLRKKIGLVSQEVFILNDSIYNNLTLGRNIKDGDLQKVIKIVDLSEMISNDKGINGEVGENGISLSGGQRQKIAIARMLLQGTKVLIFDEATSAIDNYSQERIVNAIQKNYSDRLIIVIGHRLNAIRGADYIYYIGENQILEQGTLKELEEMQGHTYKLLISDSI